ncbi:unnamed protein product [Rotaria sp. Silwood2]|nr:unnamed protein product [Rotaria sp. Silwood2]CAF2993629.1 unnamed protein product [Rotaria sp. Silwood2]CAF3327173.1 unnamed protein product [Rotaria sp. Silwood2]CAF4081301.1 unnamed protein product [Rotaria sp. Silwood2]CAF4208352.1 unnamed protein product [Rotaria sp. Silwood2]
MTFFLPPPYTTCTDKISTAIEAMLEKYHGADYRYSENICFQLCLQTYVYEQCGCVNPVLWNARSIVLPNTSKVILAPLCNQSNTCYIPAANVLLSTASLTNKYCSECKEECSITDFIVQISSLMVPVEWQMNNIKRFVENSTIPLANNWSTTWTKHIETNYVAVTVFHGMIAVENKTQTATLGVIEVLSNIGGQIGLWIGFSLLSLMEVVEMVYQLICYQCRKIRLGKRNIESIIPQ